MAAQYPEPFVSVGLGEEAGGGGQGRTWRGQGEDSKKQEHNCPRALNAASAAGGPASSCLLLSTRCDGHLLLGSKLRLNLILHKGIITSQAGREDLVLIGPLHTQARKSSGCCFLLLLLTNCTIHAN